MQKIKAVRFVWKPMLQARLAEHSIAQLKQSTLFATELDALELRACN